MISIKNLSKNYGSVEALKNISFSANRGEILALLGPNGAGKTTTMKIITGFLSSSSGEVIIDDLDINESFLSIQKRIGYLPENTPLYQELSAYEHLEFASEIHGISNVDKNKAINNVVKLCGLKEKLYFNISELSKGYKQRVALAQALIHNPDILILDEPTTGLDPNQIIEIRALIKTLGKEKTIILSTHIMQEVEAIADRVVVINEGKIVAEGTPKDLMRGKNESSYKIKITVRGAQKKVIDSIKDIKAVNDVKKGEVMEKGTASYIVFADSDIRSEVNKVIAKADLDLLEMIVEKQSMEEVFHSLTK